MAEHVFESPLVEEFYNTCHGTNGRFCSGSARGGAARRSSSNIKYKNTDHGSGKTEKSALSTTQKYGTRKAGGGGSGRGLPRPVRKQTPIKKATPEQKRAEAQRLTSQYGGRKLASAKTTKSKVAEDIRPGKAAAGLTAKYGSRQGATRKAPRSTKSALEKQNDKNQKELKTGSSFTKRASSKKPSTFAERQKAGLTTNPTVVSKKTGPSSVAPAGKGRRPSPVKTYKFK